jgi:hypothetical protein
MGEAGMALKLNFSTQLSDKRKLARIAKALGYVQTRGRKGEGSIRALLEAIIEEKMVILPKEQTPSTHRYAQVLEEMAAEGLITRPKPDGTPARINRAIVEGEPVSVTIIRERR